MVSGASTAMQSQKEVREDIAVIPSLFICITEELLRNQAYLNQCLIQLHRCQQQHSKLETSLIADHMEKKVFKILHSQ